MSTERLNIEVRENGSRTVSRNLDEIGAAAARGNTPVQMLSRALAGLTIGAGFIAATAATSKFANAMAEVSTLVDTTVWSMEELNKTALDQAKAFGSMPVEQSKAMYQIISAGATSAANAAETMDAANRLAVGGVTDLTTAADGLTSALNGYGDKIASAADASDTMFIAMRAGKTTIGELSSSLGVVAPLAAATGVSFQELMAAASAITKGGVQTSVAMTGLRAVLAAVAKPSSEAAKLANKLGIEFNVAGVQARGFAGFLEHLKEKTDGNTEILAELFGGVEALVPIMALTGAQAQSMTDIMAQMEGRAGATADAFDKMAASPGFQFGRLMAAAQVEVIKLSTSFTSMLVPVMKTLADNMGSVTSAIKTLITALVLFGAALAVKMIYGYVAGLMALQMALGATSLASAAAAVAVRGLGIALAFIASPLVLLAGTALALGAAFTWMSNESAQAQGILDSLGGTAVETDSQLEQLRAAAVQAGIGVDTTGTAASTAHPLMMGIAQAYQTAAAGARQLAQDARAAAIAVAQGKIAELKSKQVGLVGAEADIRQNGWQAKGSSYLKHGLNVWKGDILGMGPTTQERRDGAWALDRQIKEQQEIIGLIQKGVPLPDQTAPVVDVPSITMPAGADSKNKPKKGAGAGSETRAEFLARVNRETENSIGLAGVLDKQMRQIKGDMFAIDEQLAGRDFQRLTEGEAEALRDKLVAQHEANEVAMVRDSIMDRFQGPQKDYLRVLKASQVLLEAEAISQDEFNRVLLDAEYASLANDLTEAAGARRGMIEIMRQETDQAYDLERALVGIWADARGPQLDFEAGLKAVNILLGENKINADEAADATRRLRMEYLATKRDTASGLELGRLRVEDESGNMQARMSSAYKSEWDAANKPLMNISDRAAALKQLMIDDPINSGQYALALREVGLEALQLRVSLPGADAFDAMRGGLAAFVQDFKGVLPGLQQAWGNAFQRLGDGVANALSRAIVYGENLGDALKDVARSAIQELIAALIKMGIQWLVMSVLGQTAQAAIAATSAATGATVAAAWAPAAAATSLATFGANSMPAIMGMSAAYATSATLSKIPGFQSGGSTGDRGISDIAGFVHGKEFVMNAEATRQHRGLLELLNAGKTPGYKKGGYVGNSSALGLGTSKAVQGSQRGGDRNIYHIDARGADAGVEERLREALAEVEDRAVERTRKERKREREYMSNRQRIGTR